MDDKLVKHVDILIERYPVLKSCKDDIVNAYNILEQSYSSGGKLLVCGNGGSASDSEHIVGELMKEFKLKRKVPLKAKIVLSWLCIKLREVLLI